MHKLIAASPHKSDALGMYDQRPHRNDSSGGDETTGEPVPDFTRKRAGSRSQRHIRVLQMKSGVKEASFEKL